MEIINVMTDWFKKSQHIKNVAWLRLDNDYLSSSMWPKN